MYYDAQSLGQFIKRTRKSLGVTQKELALSSNTGLRFIIELEQGKHSCQLQKALDVMKTLGIKLTLKPPRQVE